MNAEVIPHVLSLFLYVSGINLRLVFGRAIPKRRLRFSLVLPLLQVS
jgi:hypothetical protein